MPTCGNKQKNLSWLPLVTCTGCVEVNSEAIMKKKRKAHVDIDSEAEAIYYPDIPVIYKGTWGLFS